MTLFTFGIRLIGHGTVSCTAQCASLNVCVDVCVVITGCLSVILEGFIMEARCIGVEREGNAIFAYLVSCGIKVVFRLRRHHDQHV